MAYGWRVAGCKRERAEYPSAVNGQPPTWEQTHGSWGPCGGEMEGDLGATERDGASNPEPIRRCGDRHRACRPGRGCAAFTLALANIIVWQFRRSLLNRMSLQVAQCDRRPTEAIGSLRPSPGRGWRGAWPGLYRSRPWPKRNRRRCVGRRSRPLCGVERPRLTLAFRCRSSLRCRWHRRPPLDDLDDRGAYVP